MSNLLNGWVQGPNWHALYLNQKKKFEELTKERDELKEALEAEIRVRNFNTDNWNMCEAFYISKLAEAKQCAESVAQILRAGAYDDQDLSNILKQLDRIAEALKELESE